MHAAGDKIDRYVIERLLGEGGMGQVYVAYDTRLRRKVALKVLRAGGSSTASAERLLKEARAVASFTHPNIVAIHDVLDVKNEPCLVMELVVGRSLRSIVDDASVSQERKLRYLASIARACDAAHRAGLIHRDLKPDNVMVQEDDTVKVLDFGIAKRVEAPPEPTSDSRDPAPPSTRTDEGKVLGTPAYMAPEQRAGWMIDGRADQFAWGVIAIELLSGRRPIAASPASTRPLLTGHVPERVVEIVARAVSRSPDDRFPTMDDLAQALEPTERMSSTSAPAIASRDVPTVAERHVRSTGATVVDPAAPRRRARWRWLALVGLVAGIGAVTFVWVRVHAKGETIEKGPRVSVRELGATPFFSGPGGPMSEASGNQVIELGVRENDKIVFAAVRADAIEVRDVPPEPAPHGAIAALVLATTPASMDYYVRYHSPEYGDVVIGRRVTDDGLESATRLDSPVDRTIFDIRSMAIGWGTHAVVYTLIDDGVEDQTQRVAGEARPYSLRRFPGAAIVYRLAVKNAVEIAGPVALREHWLLVDEERHLVHGSIAERADASPEPQVIASDAGMPVMFEESSSVGIVWVDAFGGALHHLVLSSNQPREDASAPSDGRMPAATRIGDRLVVAWRDNERLHVGCGATLSEAVRSRAIATSAGVSYGPYMTRINDGALLAWLVLHDGKYEIHRALVSCL